MPICGILIALVLVLGSDFATLNWPRMLTVLSAISLTFAPYGWLFDAAIMSLEQFAIMAALLVGNYSLTKKLQICTAITVVQVCLLILINLYGYGLGMFFGYPGVFDFMIFIDRS